LGLGGRKVSNIKNSDERKTSSTRLNTTAEKANAEIKRITPTNSFNFDGQRTMVRQNRSDINLRESEHR